MKHHSQDMVRIYLKEIGRYPLLSSEQEIELGRKIQKSVFITLVQEKLSQETGRKPTLEELAIATDCSSTKLKKAIANGKKAKEQMIQTNLRLVVAIAKRYQHRGLEFMDIIQEGNIGLSQAVEKFDPEKGFKFSTYAYWWIRQAITRAIAQKSHSIYLPSHITEKLNKIKKARRELSQQQGKLVTVSEIAMYLEENPEKIRFLLSANSNHASLNMLVGDERKSELIEFLEDDKRSSENYLLEIERFEQIEFLLSHLSPIQQEILKQRFGLGSEPPKSLAKIGERCGLSRERVRQIESYALKKLRQNVSLVK